MQIIYIHNEFIFINLIKYMKETLHMELTLHREGKKSNLKTKFQEQISDHKKIINNIKANNEQKAMQSRLQLRKQDVNLNPIVSQVLAKQLVQKVYKLQQHLPVDTKNQNISDTDKMIYQKRFKNFLNHRQQFQAKAKERRQKMIQRRKDKEAGIPDQQNYQNQYINKEQIMSQTRGQNNFSNAEQMLAYYEQITLGKKNKNNRVQLYHAQKMQYLFRKQQFQYLVMLEVGSDQVNHQERDVSLINYIKKASLFEYLFDQPSIMMLYSVNPYQLGDQLAEFETQIQGLMVFEEFSNFLLIDRQPTYFQYSKQNLEQARKLGRGIKCQPIISKWIADQDTYEWLIQMFRQVDILGEEQVQKEVLARKIRKEAIRKRILNQQIIQIVNINKLITLDRLLYQVEYSTSEDGNISLEQFENLLEKYHRLQTPEKDKLISRLVLLGKYDPSYIFILAASALEAVKQVFNSLPKFAEYFVTKQKFVQKLVKSPKYSKIRDMPVRAEGNRFVKKQNVQQTLVRFLNQAESYVDIQEVLDFFTNRGRPKNVQYQIYITNLQMQIALIEEEERSRLRKKLSSGDYSTSSDQEQFQRSLKEKKVQRKKDKLASIRASQKFTQGKKFNVTVPNAFSFGNGTKPKSKLSIREKKLKQSLDHNKRLENQSMQPVKPQPVPSHVTQNLYQKNIKQQQRERKERLERFRLESKHNMYPVSPHLLQRKTSKSVCYTPGQQYKFVAKPLPWFCEVNLLERIQKQKQERRERILEQIINKHNDMDLSQGFKNIIQKGQKSLQQKQRLRALSKTTKDCTFRPKITQNIPDFKIMHQHLEIDLQNRKQQKQPIQIVPFSFQNRPHRSRTAIEPKNLNNYNPKESNIQGHKNKLTQEQVNIPVTMKYQALIKLRREQQVQKQSKIEEQKRASTVRKMRQQKFAPYVRSVLRNSQCGDIARSRAIVEQKIKQFKKQERRKKQQYEEEMINIYTKVFNRPLLVQGREDGKNINEEEGRRPSYSGHKNKSKQRNQKHNQRDQIQRFAQDYEMPQQSEQQHSKRHHNKDYDMMRRKAIQHPPRNYLMQDPNEGQGHIVGHYEEQDYQDQYLSQNGRYTN